MTGAQAMTVAKGMCVGCGTGQGSRWSLRILGGKGGKVSAGQGSSTQGCPPGARFEPGGGNRVPQDWGQDCRAHEGTPLALLQDMGGT